jgi:hypothetical protein
MPLDFPTSPTNGQAYQGYVYSTTVGAWQAKPSAQSPFYTSDTPPSNPVTGDSWFNTNDGTMYIYVYDGNTFQWVEHRSEIARSQVGLVPVVPTSVNVGSGTASVAPLGLVSFTTATSVSLNSVFTSAYNSYKMIIRISAQSAAAQLGYRYRNAGTDNSTSNYYQTVLWNRSSGTTQTNNGTNTVNYFFGWNSTTAASYLYWTGDIINPAIPSKTHLYGKGSGDDSTSYYVTDMASMFNIAANTFDGITLFPSAGNVTGTVQILGYNQ